MAALSVQMEALARKPQRRMLLALFRRNPQDDTPIDSDDPEPEDENVERLLDFRHYHLPELDEKGFVNYNREENTVTRGPHFEEIEPLLELIDEHRDELPDDWL